MSKRDSVTRTISCVEDLRPGESLNFIRQHDGSCAIIRSYSAGLLYRLVQFKREGSTFDGAMASAEVPHDR